LQRERILSLPDWAPIIILSFEQYFKINSIFLLVTLSGLTSDGKVPKNILPLTVSRIFLHSYEISIYFLIFSKIIY